VKSRSLRGLTDFQPHTNPDNPLQPFYTRAGSFTPDSDGLLRNAAGFYLKGWTLNPDGSMPANRSAPP
jgi:flagellar hook protein FlgE